jgi:hypothetical protein
MARFVVFAFMSCRLSSADDADGYAALGEEYNKQPILE